MPTGRLPASVRNTERRPRDIAGQPLDAGFRRTRACASTHRSSNRIPTAVILVMPLVSSGGETSTRSAPTRSRPPNSRIRRWTSSVVRPPGSGVPVYNHARLLGCPSPSLVVKLLDRNHAHTLVMAELPHISLVQGATNADLDRALRIDEPLFDRPAKPASPLGWRRISHSTTFWGTGSSIDFLMAVASLVLPLRTRSIACWTAARSPDSGAAATVGAGASIGGAGLRRAAAALSASSSRLLRNRYKFDPPNHPKPSATKSAPVTTTSRSRRGSCDTRRSC